MCIRDSLQLLGGSGAVLVDALLGIHELLFEALLDSELLPVRLGHFVVGGVLFAGVCLGDHLVGVELSLRGSDPGAVTGFEVAPEGVEVRGELLLMGSHLHGRGEDRGEGKGGDGEEEEKADGAGDGKHRGGGDARGMRGGARW